MIFQVFRTHTSDYLGESFLEKEQSALQKIDGLTYCESLSQVDPEKPLILIGSSQSKYEEFTRQKYKQLQLVIHANSGFDNISVDWCDSLTIPIIACHEIRQYAVSEYILACLFEHFTKIPRRENWNRTWDRKLLAQQKILLLGFGHIGKIVYQNLLPLAKNIVISDPFKGWETNTDDVFDVIINCTSLNPTTKEFIDKDFLKKLSPQGLFINAARGKSVQEKDLLDFLTQNPNATAYLDVFANEPMDFKLIKDFSNIIPTSHQAGVFKNISKQVIETEKRILQNFINLKEAEFTEMYKDEILSNRIIEFNGKRLFR